jgi:hypothetical protein
MQLMPALKDPGHEAFAQAVARGATRQAAHVQAGYEEDSRKATQLGARPTIKARVAEIEAELKRADPARLTDTILALLELAAAANKLESAAGIKEARLARLDALRLRELLDKARPPPVMRKVFTRLTDEQWLEAFGSDA